MFEENSKKVVIGGANQLHSTPRLVSMATVVVNEIMKKIAEDEAKYEIMVEDSKDDHSAMDKLVDALVDLETVDVDFLKAEETDELDKMIRSQQSKRSRTKSMHMTLENFKSMLNGCVCEKLLRIAANKPKSSTGGGSVSLVFTAEQLEGFKNNQEDLRRELRNVQSKKSIAKTKRDFDASSLKWIQLLEAEKNLKEIRTTAPQVSTVIKEMIEDVDVSSLKAEEARQLLLDLQAQIK